MSSIVAVMLAASGTAIAHEDGDESLTQQLNEARLEGQLWTAYSLNSHLNPFDLDVDVQGNTAVIAGKVNDSVQKDLAAEIALGTDGIEDVDNRIQVVQDNQIERHSAGEDDRGFGDRVSDLTTTATIKSKLLWNRNTGGFGIDVSTKGGNVVLEGEADSEAGKELAGRLAANTDGVHNVENRIAVNPDMETPAAGEDDRSFDEAVSDGWITTKVKSTLLFSSNVSGTAINVDTKEGVVSLAGEVASGAEKDLAVKLAEDVRGVKQVDASNLQVAG